MSRPNNRDNREGRRLNGPTTGITAVAPGRMAGVALCRAAGIPARAVYGFATSWQDTPRHAWAEVFLPRKGWVSFDPLAGDLRRAVFGRFAPRYVHLSAVRNDPRIDSFYYYSWRTRGGVATITDSFQVREVVPEALPR